uniref:Uncharacterized protein n=1 Tax=Chenopodium quinoa TaxID=63459 RepID=A0A803MMX7_CHEQI
MDQQRLIMGDKELVDNKDDYEDCYERTLADYNVNKDTTLQLTSRLGSRDNVKKVCRKWRLWWKTRHLARLQPFFGPRASVNEWILNDLIYNDGRDFHAWINNDMTVYFDGFPLLFKEDV